MLLQHGLVSTWAMSSFNVAWIYEFSYKNYEMLSRILYDDAFLSSPLSKCYLVEWIQIFFATLKPPFFLSGPFSCIFLKKWVHRSVWKLVRRSWIVIKTVSFTLLFDYSHRQLSYNFTRRKRTNILKTFEVKKIQILNNRYKNFSSDITKYQNNLFIRIQRGEIFIYFTSSRAICSQCWIKL